MNRKQIGVLAEREAQAYLVKHGILILTTNFYAKVGEIDIIAKDQSTLVFIEVRARRSELYGTSAETITDAKRQRIILAAQVFLQRHPALATVACRFDVIEIKLNKNSNSVYWIQDAFVAI